MRETLTAVLVALLCSPIVQGQLAVRGDTVYTMAGDALRDGVVLLRDGKIERIGTSGSVQIPSGYRTVQAKVVTPGLIDAHSVVGLSGYLNQSHDQDQLERSDALQPELRAIDAYNPRERLVEYVRSLGITTIHTGHGPGSVISGQTMITKTAGESVDDAVLVPTAMVAATLGPRSEAPEGKSPGSRAKAVAMLRAKLVEATEYSSKRETAEEGEQPDRDLSLEVLGRVLKGELPLLVTVNRVHDILTAIRLADEFGFRLVLDGTSEVYLALDQVKSGGYDVILHPTMRRASGDAENVSFETASKLRAAGIRFALQSGFESYVPKTRIVLFEAAFAAANGLSFEEALASITIDAARILRVDNRVGSLQVGKDADVALFDGDPFEYTSHSVGVIIDGEMVSEGESYDLQEE